MIAALFVAAGVAASQGAAASGVVAEPDGYRMGDYRAPVPATLQGATVVDAEALRALLERGADVALIDVLPRDRKPEDFPADRLWRPPARHHIPDSTWLPNVGYGRLSAAYQRYFVDNLEKLTNHRTGRILVFYCDAGCWMSWNAAKRAIALGFQKVYWFPGGVDEWQQMGYALVAGDAVEMPQSYEE